MALAVEPAIEKLDRVLALGRPVKGAGIFKRQINFRAAAGEHLRGRAVAGQGKPIGCWRERGELNAVGGELLAAFACRIGKRYPAWLGRAEIIGAQANPLRPRRDAAEGILAIADVL